MINISRTEKFNNQGDNCTPGPGSYEDGQCASGTATKSSFFASKMKRQLQFIQLSNTLGPGQYFKGKPQDSPSYAKSIKSKTSNKNICPLKSSRQDILKQQNTKLQFQKQVDEMMRKQRQPCWNKSKLIGFKQRKQLKTKLNQQILPSIPSSQHSFGYRYDAQNHKLINNINPKILFSDNNNTIIGDTNKSSNSKDFYFQRMRGQEKPKGGCYIMNSTTKRFQTQIKSGQSYPDPTSYSYEKYQAISYSIKPKNHDNGKMVDKRYETCHFINVDSNMKNIDILKFNKLKRQFKEYIKQDELTLGQFEQLQKMQKQQKLKDRRIIDIHRKEKEEKLDFFLSKQERFVERQNVHKQHENIQEKSQSKTDDKKTQTNQKQLFKLGPQRFKKQHKQMLGPGSYDINQIKNNRAVLLNHFQKRFNDKVQQDTPGPGRYNPKQPLTHNSKELIHSRSHKDYQALIHPLQKQKPMSSLYQQVGKQMNYFEKVFKLSNKIEKKCSKRPTISVKKHTGMNVIKKQLEKTLENHGEHTNHKILQVDQKQNNSKNHGNHKNAALKFKHLYNYFDPIKPVNDLGPGHYKLRSSLEKKTFNKTIEHRS